MGKYAKVDISELEEEILKMKKVDIEEFYMQISKEIARRFLRQAIKLTPVGTYPKSSGKVGGTLRRGWTADVGGDITAKGISMQAPLCVKKRGNNYIVETKNNVDYASYVNYGHRTTNGGFVAGQFFMNAAEDAVKDILDELIEKRFINFLKRKGLKIK